MASAALEYNQSEAATNQQDALKQRLSTGLRWSDTCQTLTNWSVKDRHQQAWSTVKHDSHSLSGVSWTGIISSLRYNDTQSHSQTDKPRTGGHMLEGQQGTSATYKLRVSQRLALSACLKCYQGIGVTHKLESRGEVSSASLRHSQMQQPLTS